MDNEENIAREIWRQACVIASRKERDAFLSSACGVNPRLRSRVETMLKAEPDGGGPHEALANTGGPDSKTTMIVAASTGVPEGPGTVIGRYKLLERIGEGGFGAVYMAQQIEPINRRVALKIIKQGMDTEEVVARFDAERQALALMDHPNVARVLDGGATPSGRPYFVMELVTGLPITDFCDRNRLTTRERIDLFLAVCHAIQHAHSKGIVHRDLKPSNILVTMQEGLAVPKVIDFGLAKAMQTPLTDKTLFTRFGHMVGTPIYMSPEQLGGADVDTRSDVYSLGVILYELLTGKQPFDWQQLCAAGEREMWRVIEEEDPPPPSTRLTRLGQELAAVAQHRNVSPRRLSELVRGDLDWITMKALQKNRSHRYATPLALAEDLQRHLDHQPVSAGPPRFGYRAWKFARRHRYAVTASAGIVISLVAGLIFATMGFLRAREQRERALLAEHHAEQQRQIAFSEAQRARSNETQARQISYASDMALASHALDISNLGRVLPLLRRHLPVAGAEDLRNWEWRYLWQQCRSGELFQLANVSNSIVSIAVSRDGRLVAIADLSGQTAVYDLPARALLWSTNASPNIALSPDGKVLADGTGQIRDAETGVILNRLPVEESIKRLAFSPDGTCLAGLVGRDHVCLWRSNDWKLTATYKGFPSASLLFGKMAFFTSAERIAIGTEDGRVRIAELRDGRIRHDWQAHTESISAMALAPDARFLATGAGYSDNEIKLWRPEDGALAGTLRGHRAWVIALAFSPDGALLASASADQTICLWDMHTQELVARLRGHLFEVWGVTFHPDGKTLFSADKEGAVKCWRVPLPKSNSSQTELQLNDFGFAESVTSEFAFTPDGRELLTLDSTTGKVRRRILPSLKSLGEIEPLGTNNYMVASSPKLRLAASLDRDGCLKVWDFDKEVVQTNCAVGASAGRRAWVGFAPGNRRLIAVVDYRTVMQWELTPWKQVGNWTFNERVFGPFSVSPDGRFLANGGNSLVVYSLANGTILKRIQANRLTTDVVAFSPDGSWLASGSQEGVAKVWRTGSWQEVGTLRGHLLGVHGLAFSADGRRLVTGSSGNETAKMWDLATMQEVLNLSGPGDLTFWLGFSPDGRTLLGLGISSGVRCWYAPSIAEIPL